MASPATSVLQDIVPEISPQLKDDAAQRLFFCVLHGLFQGCCAVDAWPEQRPGIAPGKSDIKPVRLDFECGIDRRSVVQRSTFRGAVVHGAGGQLYRT